MVLLLPSPTAWWWIQVSVHIDLCVCAGSGSFNRPLAAFRRSLFTGLCLARCAAGIRENTLTDSLLLLFGACCCLVRAACRKAYRRDAHDLLWRIRPLRAVHLQRCAVSPPRLCPRPGPCAPVLGWLCSTYHACYETRPFLRCSCFYLATIF